MKPPLSTKTGVLIIGIVLVAASVTWAADEANGEFDLTGLSLEELLQIKVTARRYEEDPQRVPLSVNVMSRELLRDQDLKTVRDVIDFSPGGSTTAFNKMQEEYSLRGVSSQTEGPSADSSVATVIDNVVISREFMKSQAFFDMERIEILRGPQGTAFGRNAASGMVHLQTARPTRGRRSGLVAQVGFQTVDFEGFVSGPLSESLAGRLAVNFDELDGYTEDTRSGGRLGAERNLGVRGSLLFKPSDAVQVFVKAEVSRDEDANPVPRKGLDCTIPYQGDFPQDSIVGAPQPPWTQFPNWRDSCDPWETTVSAPTYLGDFFLEREIFNLSSEVVWGVNNDFSVTAISAYLSGNSDYLIDTHGGPNNSMFQSTQNDAWQASQELRVDNHGAGKRLSWLSGLYFLTDDQTRDDQNIFYVDNAVADPQHPSGFRPETRDVKQQNNQTTSYGLFGELSFNFTEKLNGTLGGRWSDDEKDYSVAHYGWGWGGPIAGLTNGEPGNACLFAPGGPPDFGQRFCGTPEAPVGFRTPVPTSGTWDNLSLQGSLSYSLGNHQMIYGRIAEGYKTGGFQNEPFNPSDALLPYDEETVTNYEVGYKGTVGGRLRFNASVFTTDYKDLQLFLFRNSPTGDYSQVTVNAADADIEGFEIESVLQVSSKLRFMGTYAHIDSKLVNALIDADGDGVLEDFSGTRPDNTPTWTGTAVAEFRQPLRGESSLTLRADWRGVSDIYDDIGEDPNRRHEGYGLFGARASWRHSTWGISLWGKNLTDEAYTIQVGPYQPNVNQLNFAYGAPRTFGITLSTNWN